jgi:hypothetical protein
MESTASRFIAFYRSDWAPACESLARSLAVAIVATYAAGYAAGRILHRLNDRLASMASGRQPQRPSPPPAPVAAPIIRQPQAAATVQTRTAAIQSPPLDTLTVAQLRIMARAAGHKRLARSGRRADLLAVLA